MKSVLNNYFNNSSKIIKNIAKLEYNRYRSGSKTHSAQHKRVRSASAAAAAAGEKLRAILPPRVHGWFQLNNSCFITRAAWAYRRLQNAQQPRTTPLSVRIARVTALSTQSLYWRSQFVVLLPPTPLTYFPLSLSQSFIQGLVLCACLVKRIFYRLYLPRLFFLYIY